MVQLERHVIKGIMVFIFGLSFTICKAQMKYFLMDSTNNDFKHYSIKTDALYDVKEEIELFNILLKNPNNKAEDEHFDTDLILFSVLPDFDSIDNWEAVDLDSLKSCMISLSKLRKMLMESTFQIFDASYSEKTKYFNEYKLIIYRNGKYITPKNCLLQFFAIRNRPVIFNSLFGTINLDGELVTIKDMLKFYVSQKRRSDFPLESFLNDYAVFDRIRDRKEFLSQKLKIGGHNAYQFWTYTDWPEKYLPNVERGIDRFIYIPNLGIVGGSFDFYFAYHSKRIGLNWKKFLNNIYEEKVLVAAINN